MYHLSGLHHFDTLRGSPCVRAMVPLYHVILSVCISPISNNNVRYTHTQNANISLWTFLSNKREMKGLPIFALELTFWLCGV